MGLFDKYREPVFLKETSSAEEQLKELEELKSLADEGTKQKIEQDIRLLKAGIIGEENIAFELKNSHMPMFIIHDLFIKDDDLTAQIDYVIITKKRVFVVECKNLVGDIEINSRGEFIRKFENGKKEGIYSPITQNKRHLELIKKIRADQKSNALLKAMYNRWFYDSYKSVVVLANPKSILNSKYASKEIKEQVIRADGLIEYIKRVNSLPGVEAISEKDFENLAASILKMGCVNPKNYVMKYKNLIEASKKEASPLNNNIQPLCPKCGAAMVKRVARAGKNAGNEFWGCTNYPSCRGIVNIKPMD